MEICGAGPSVPKSASSGPLTEEMWPFFYGVAGLEGVFVIINSSALAVGVNVENTVTSRRCRPFFFFPFDDESASFL